MKRLFFPLILFLLTILEGAALELLPSNLVMGNLMIVPHWVFAFLVYMAIFYDKDYTYYSIGYALLFGLLIDVVYTGVLGVYMFSYGLAIYIVHGLKKILQGNFYVVVLLGTVGVLLADLFIYLIYTSVGIVDMVFQDYTLGRMLPTILSNIVFILLLYPFCAKRLARWQWEQLSGKSTL
ncbi:rod shape-determining protein MreD [Oceanobacillus rekensis]|uniref:rod shape-determining protein MreD n=1 Tax=Oceanobacillus rekensis TaxID=937927 RepID=UPI000B437181|nr:rod shape-determining protein MreD [Oceanobacillus rekensis]